LCQVVGLLATVARMPPGPRSVLCAPFASRLSWRPPPAHDRGPPTEVDAPGGVPLPGACFPVLGVSVCQWHAVCVRPDTLRGCSSPASWCTRFAASRQAMVVRPPLSGGVDVGFSLRRPRVSWLCTYRHGRSWERPSSPGSSRRTSMDARSCRPVRRPLPRLAPPCMAEAPTCS